MQPCPGRYVSLHSMDNSLCCVCQKPKATLVCGICKNPVCKKCAQFTGEESFSFLTKIPENLTHGTYCGPCFDEQVAPELAVYEETMERAKDVAIFFKDQGKETRWVKRSKEIFKVLECPDRDETLMRLAFQAAQKNFNSLVDVDLVSEKIRNGSYQTQKWSGTAVPANIESRKLGR